MPDQRISKGVHMFCSKCSTEAPISSTLLSSCGESLEEKSRSEVPLTEPTKNDENRLSLRNGIIALVILIVSVLVVYGLATGTLAEFVGSFTGYSSGVSARPLDLTMDEFNQISEGMSLDDINKIFRFDGVLLSEIQGVKMYAWKYKGAMVMISFSAEGKYVSKGQVGLQ